MKWPWVSRRALDVLERERERLLADLERAHAELERLTDAIVRISRREHGMTEVPREPRAPLDAMPRELREHIESWGSRETREGLRTEAWRRRRDGQQWEEIAGDMLPGREDGDG